MEQTIVRDGDEIDLYVYEETMAEELDKAQDAPFSEEKWDCCCFQR